jgi:hypothetical protein
MTPIETGVRKLDNHAHVQHLAASGGAILLAALIIAWPAIYNGFPLLYPDSMTYLDDGRVVARAVFLHRFSDYYGMRSFFYSLGILPLHWNLTAWPVVAAQCLLTACILWLVVRSIAPRRTVLPYLILVLLLSVLTGMSWYATVILPDFLGPLLYLSIYLLVFARHTLSRAERWLLYVASWWAVTSHATHLLLSAGLCVILALLLAFGRRVIHVPIRLVCEVTAIVVLAAAAQLALNGYLYGEPSLNGERPPFLTARIIADGPGRWYLEKHCGELNWVICRHVKNLPDDPDDFLWGDDGIYQTDSTADNKLLVQQEIPFVLATLRAYPTQQLSRSAANFLEQLTTFDFYDLDPSSWVLDQFSSVLPRARADYLKGRQAHDALPLELLTSIQIWSVSASLAVIVVLIPLLWRRHSPCIAGLGLVIVSMVVSNALITGTLSMVEGRFGCRVIWLVPTLAALMVLDWLRQRESRKRRANTEKQANLSSQAAS